MCKARGLDPLVSNNTSESEFKISQSGLPWWLNGKKSACQRGDMGSIPDPGRPNMLLLLFRPWIGSDSLWPHRLQHVRLTCFPLSPRVCSYSCSLSQWYYLTISSSAIPVSFCLEFLPASGYFPMSWFFASGSQSIITSASVLPMNIQDWFHLGLTGLVSQKSKGFSRAFSSTTIQKHQFFGAQPSL